MPYHISPTARKNSYRKKTMEEVNARRLRPLIAPLNNPELDQLSRKPQISPAVHAWRVKKIIARYMKYEKRNKV
jgi:hypothetical protein